MSKLTSEEKKILAPFFSNLDKNIFVLINLPEVVKGALFSRYSRSSKDLRRMLLDEFLLHEESGMKASKNRAAAPVLKIVDAKKAEGFYDRVLVSYGDDSVAELAGVHIACENVSQLIGAKAIEDNRIGISPLEKSTRYVRFDDKDERGRWKYYVDPDIARSSLAGEYRETSDFLFETYASLVEPLSTYLMTRYPKESEMTDRAYTSTMRAKACDVLRQLLPCSTLTNVGIYGNGRALEYTIIKMLTSPFAEVRELAKILKEELDKVIPSFVKRSTNERGVESQEYLMRTQQAIAKLARSLNVNFIDKPTQPMVKLVDYDVNIEEKILIGFLFDKLHLPYHELKALIKKLSRRKRVQFFKDYFSLRQHRTHKPGRALEMVDYTFDIVSTIACYKDLQRHRMLSLYKGAFTTDLGYEIPSEIKESRLEKPYVAAMDQAAKTCGKLSKKFLDQAQYVIPIGYNYRWLFKMSLREVAHLTELRSTRQGHPSYRFTAQEIAKRVREVHPLLGTLATRFVDFNSYDVERWEAEKRIDRKLKQLTRSMP